MKRQQFIYQAILTKYLPATDRKVARIKATADAGSVTLSWDHALNPPKNAEAAARALAEKHGWLADGSRMVQGGLSGPGYVFVILDPRDA